ncbi:MAG: hypothetical protein M1820_000675 [Bogoriella megaspora]|nr:MAG: hypothetical protein M1820_000675 [Bogoriella megaspora]
MPVVRARSVAPSAFSSTFTRQRTTTYADISPTSNPRGPSPKPSPLNPTLSWAPLGNLIATASDRTIRVWNPEKPNVKNSTELRGGHMGYVEVVAFNPDREAELVSVGRDGVVKFWDVRNKKSVGEVKIGGEGYAAAWLQDGSEVMVCKREGEGKERKDTLVPISLPSMTARDSFPQDRVTPNITFGNSGKQLYLTRDNGHIDMLSYPSMKHQLDLHGHTCEVWCVAHSPHGRFIATGSEDSIMTIWNAKTFIPQRGLGKIDGAIRSLSFSFDGFYIVGGSDEEDTPLEIAHAETGEYVCSIPTPHPPTCVAWHPHRYALAYTGDPAGLKIIGGISGDSSLQQDLQTRAQAAVQQQQPDQQDTISGQRLRSEEMKQQDSSAGIQAAVQQQQIAQPDSSVKGSNAGVESSLAQTMQQSLTASIPSTGM